MSAVTNNDSVPGPDEGMMMQRWIGLILGVLFLFSGGVLGQGDTLDLALAEEHDIGFGCPAAALVEPGTATLWVLMHNCVYVRYSLLAFDLYTREPVRDPIDIPVADSVNYSVDSFTSTPLTGSDAFPSPDGRYLAYQPAYEDLRVIDLETGVGTETLTVNEPSSAVQTCLNSGTDGFFDYSRLRVYSLSGG